MIHGENLILAINGTPLAASKSCSLSKSGSFIEVSSPTDGAWESFVPSKKGWSMSSDCLLATMDAYITLDAAWKAGTALTIRFFNTEYDENETGTAYIDKLDLQASKGNLAKMSVSLKGSGPLVQYAGTNIPFTKSLLQNGKYYTYMYNDNYTIQSEENGKVYGGSISLSKRTMVQVTGYGCYLFFSQDSGLIEKATNGENILNTDYSARTQGDEKVWLDAGTWYIVVSNQNYTSDPQLRAISI